MRTRRLEQTALTTLLIASCVMFLFAAFAAQAHNTPAAPRELPAVSAHHNVLFEFYCSVWMSLSRITWPQRAISLLRNAEAAAGER
jgi:hypothetical protein